MGGNGKNWLLNPESSSQSEGYSSKWIIWLVVRKPLTVSFSLFVPAVFHGGWLVVPDLGGHSPPLPKVKVNGTRSMKLEVVYLRPVVGQDERVGNSIRGGARWEQQLV